MNLLCCIALALFLVFLPTQQTKGKKGGPTQQAKDKKVWPNIAKEVEEAEIKTWPYDSRQCPNPKQIKQYKRAGCFYWVRVKSREEAETECKKVHTKGRLASVDGHLQEQWLNRQFYLATNVTGNYTYLNDTALIWIGLQRLKDNYEEWDWDDQENDAWYRNWAKGEPNNKEGEELCAAVNVTRKGGVGKWLDVRCDKTDTDPKYPVQWAYCRLAIEDKGK